MKSSILRDVIHGTRSKSRNLDVASAVCIRVCRGMSTTPDNLPFYSYTDEETGEEVLPPQPTRSWSPRKTDNLPFYSYTDEETGEEVLPPQPTKSWSRGPRKAKVTIGNISTTEKNVGPKVTELTSLTDMQ